MHPPTAVYRHPLLCVAYLPFHYLCFGLFCDDVSHLSTPLPQNTRTHLHVWARARPCLQVCVCQCNRQHSHRCWVRSLYGSGKGWQADSRRSRYKHESAFLPKVLCCPLPLLLILLMLGDLILPHGSITLSTSVNMQFRARAVFLACCYQLHTSSRPFVSVNVSNKLHSNFMFLPSSSCNCYGSFCCRCSIRRD